MPGVGGVLRCRSALLAFNTGVLTDADATFTVLLEESNAADTSGANAVDDTDMIGSEALASFTFADDGECRKLGYVGYPSRTAQWCHGRVRSESAHRRRSRRPYSW